MRETALETARAMGCGRFTIEVSVQPRLRAPSMGLRCSLAVDGKIVNAPIKLRNRGLAEGTLRNISFNLKHLWDNGAIFQNFGPPYEQRTMELGAQMIVPPEGMDPRSCSRMGGTYSPVQVMSIEESMSIISALYLFLRGISLCHNCYNG